MVAIFTGAGFGLERGSASVLGGVGLLGGASQGRGGEGVSVNAATGNLLLQKQDEFLVGRGPDASVGRTYNSLTTLADDNGDKWRQSTDRRVYGLIGTLNAVGSTVKRVSGDGSEIIYTWDSSRSAYLAKDGAGAYDTIVKSGTEWVWTDGESRTVERYFDDAVGKVKSVADNLGTVMTFAYDGSGRLSQVNTNDGSWIRYDWSGSTNNISQVVTGYTDLVTSTAKTLTRTRYGYDGSNRLQTVTIDKTPGDNSVSDSATYVTTYGYDASSRVNSITQSDGSSLTITYDGSGRVSTLVQTAATSVTRTTTVNYFTGYSTVTDSSGQVTRLDYDANGNLTKITAPPAYSGAAAQTAQFAYNTNGDLISTTDSRNKVTSYSNFTSNGLAQTITDRNTDVTTRTYDATNHLLSETRNGIDATGAVVAQTARYVYNSVGDLRFSISAEGRVTEYVRGGYGVVTSEIDYVEATYTTAGTPSEANMTTWTTGLADRSSVQRTDYLYDGRINLQKATTYAITTSTGNGLTTQGVNETNYVYDQAGQLLSSYATGQAATTYVYDGLGRVVATTEAGGDVLTILFDDANTKTTITNLGGRTVVNAYNKAGDLIQDFVGGTNVAGGGASHFYTTDKLGRARISYLFSIGTIYDLYDAAGRHTAMINSDGQITEYRYDANNRLVGTINYRNVISSTNLTALGDPDNTLTIAGIRPATHAQDTSSWTVYDDEGRVLQTIAGDGSTTISTYDASGRLQKMTSYVNKVAAATVAGFIAAAPTSAITPTTNAADTYSRYFYDKDGLLIGTTDGEKYLVQNTYDKHGQLVATTAYANATTASSPATASFNTLLVGVTTSSARDRTTRYVYDGRGELRYTVDALGNAVRYDYDAAGLKTRTVTYATALGALGDYTFDNILSQLSGQESSSLKRVSYAVYDSAGRLAYSLDQHGDTAASTEMAVTTYIYDSIGNLVRTIGYADRRSTSSLPTKATMDSWATGVSANADNRVTRMWYNGRGDLAFTVDAEGYVRQRGYDQGGRFGNETVWENKIAVNDSTTYAQVEALATGMSYTRVQYYDALGRVIQASDYQTWAIAYTYHGTTDLVATATRVPYGTVQEQAATNYNYDGAGRVVQVTEAAGTSDDAITAYNYDGRGFRTSVVDPRSTTTSYTYNLKGQVQTVNEAYGLSEQRTTTYEYNAFGEVWKVTDPRYNASYSWYDQLGRVTHQRDAENFLTITTYTAFGEVQSVKRWATALTGTPSIGTAPTGTASGSDATTSFTYDKGGRVLTSTDALNQIEYYFYNTFGDRSSVINRANRTTTYVIDRLGRVTREGGIAATANIDVAGTVTAGAYVVKNYDYDSRGNVKILKEGFAASFAGTLTALRTTNYEYDANSHVTQVTYDKVTTLDDDMGTINVNVTPTEQFAYDKRGNVIKSIDKVGAQTFSYYDDLDRKIAEIRQLSASTAVCTSYAYDDNGNLTTTKVYENAGVSLPSTAGGTPPSAPTGLYRQTNFYYDRLNRLTTTRVVSNSGNVLTSGSWNGSSYTQSTGDIDVNQYSDANGNVYQIIDANGIATSSWYDKLNRKTDQLDGEGYLTHWTYDAEGNVLSETRYATRFTGTVTLWASVTVTPTANDRTTVYTYDLNGNRRTEKRTGVAAWNVDANSGLLSAAGTDALITYTYNALGQVITKTVGIVQIAAYAYDGIGRLTSEQRAAYYDANGVSVTPNTTYEYDALGDLARTVQVGTGSGTYVAGSRTITYRYGEGGRLLAMVDAASNMHSYFYDVGGRLKKDAYNRIANTYDTVSSAATTSVAEAQTKTYDMAGRVLTQAVYSTVGGTFKRIGLTSFQYNNFDQVTQQGIGTNSASDIAAGTALYQTTNQYDAAGRLIGNNAGDGVWKFYGYDKAGNQTVAVTSAGATFSSGTGLASALSLVGNANVNGTYTVYDKRNQAKQVVEEGRDLSASVTNQQLSTSRTYNAFGETASETDARLNTITYTYNTMGRMIRSESPGVQITNENGSTNWIKPSEDYYYDLDGRLVATRDANGSYGAGTSGSPASKSANTGNLITLALLAGTGYDGTQALVSTEFHAADTSKKQTLYDIMGDARVIRDELYGYGGITSANDTLHITEQTFNLLGQLTQVKHNRVTDVTLLTDDSTRLIDNYVYDQFGQRLQHTNSQYGSSVIEKTRYDGLGRITVQTDMSGYTTGTAYVWNGTLATAGVGTLGGLEETTTYANARTSISKTDIYDRELFRQDLGSHQFSSTFDAAGRQLTRGNLSYTWYNTGSVATSAVVTGTIGSSDWNRKLTTYGYDQTGNRTSEQFVNDGSATSYYGTGYFSYPVVGAYNLQYVNETAVYDALGRMTSMSEAGSTYTPAASITQEYDAAGNIRHTASTHAVLDQNGAVSTTVTDNFWYRYDGLNRLVTDRGSLVGGAIVRGNSTYGTVSPGVDYVYDAVGQRIAAIRTDYSPGGLDPYYGFYPGSYQETRENYDYDGAGRISAIRTTLGTLTSDVYNSGTGLYDPPASIPTASALGGFVNSSFGYDAMGRQTSQSDYQSGVSGAVYSRSATYAANGAMLTENTSTQKFESNGSTVNTYATNSTYTFTDAATGEYLLGAVGKVTAANYKNGSFQTNSSTTNTYQWWDSAVQGAIVYKPNISNGTTYTTTFYYDAQGTLTSAYIADGRPRSVSFRTNGDGQVIRRDEADNNYNATTGGDPHEVWYRFAGRELGYVGNNGTSRTTETASVQDRRAYQNTGAFRNGTNYATSYTDFAQSSAPINSYSQGSAAGGYTVQRTGETLRSVAEQVWGDSSLWYKIAEANGLASDMALSEGQRLNLPAGVSRSHHNASTLRPYDANDATGNVSPTTPKPQKKNKCGVFGQVLLAAVAIAVTALALPAGAPTIAEGALAGLAGGAASQAVGVATGIQQKFDFKGLALSAIAGGVTAGLGAGSKLFGPNGLFGATAADGAFKVGLAGIKNVAVSAAAQGAVSSAISQGIGVATGLQSKFSWAGIAAAGIGAAVNAGIARGLNLQPLFGTDGGQSLRNIAGNTFASTAAAIANAATRSAFTGTSFGDNIVRAIPDAIGNTVGNLVAEGIAGGRDGPSSRARRIVDANGDELILGNPVTSEQMTAAQTLADNMVADAANRPRPVRIGPVLAGGTDIPTLPGRDVIVSDVILSGGTLNGRSLKEVIASGRVDVGDFCAAPGSGDRSVYDGASGLYTSCAAIEAQGTLVANRLSALGVTDTDTISKLARLPGAAFLSERGLIAIAETEVAAVQRGGAASPIGRAAQVGLVAGVVVAVTAAEMSDDNRILQCSDIGTWITDPNYGGYSLNAKSYQDFVGGRVGQNFRVSTSSGVSSTLKVDFDGCIDTPAGPELREAKASYGSLLNPGNSNWSRAPAAVTAQGRRQIAVMTELRLSHPDSNISLNWYAQMANDRGFITDIFANASPRVIGIPVIHLPGGM